MKLALTPLLALALLFGGCQSTPTSYQTLKQVGDAVDTAMVIYADAVVAGQIDEQSQAQVRNAYDTYRTAFQLAVDVARLDLKQAPPQEVVVAALTFINLITQLTAK